MDHSQSEEEECLQVCFQPAGERGGNSLDNFNVPVAQEEDGAGSEDEEECLRVCFVPHSYFSPSPGHAGSLPTVVSPTADCVPYTGWCPQSVLRVPRLLLALPGPRRYDALTWRSLRKGGGIERDF